MSRQIKFRGWSQATKLMIYGDSWQISAKYQDCKNWDGEHVLLLQFTGLLDKNGKEIYEGDIINNKSVVTFNRGRFVGCYTYEKHGGGWGYSDEWEDDLHRMVVEVIGNIYENPDLLK